MVEVGKEAEFIGHRLNDIIYLLNKTKPVRWWRFRQYHNSVVRITTSQAEQALKYVEILKAGQK